MKRFLTATFCVFACGLIVLCAACGDKGKGKKPEKLKDGITLNLKEGESVNVDLSQYISIEGTDYAYTVSSSNPETVTVSLADNTATVAAVREGGATVTAKADTVSVSFEVNVTQAQLPPPVGAADKTALAAELALEITEQGDYTTESFKLYTQKLAAAKSVNEKPDATQEEVDEALNELKSARENLAVRLPEEVDGAEKTFIIIAETSREFTVSEFIDSKNLSGITYEISSDNGLISAGEVNAGKFTLSAGKAEEDAEVTVTLSALYKGETKLSVEIVLQVKSEPQPYVKHSRVTNSVDIFNLEDKDSLTVDFTENIETNGIENLVYTVTSGGNGISLDGDNRYAYPLDGEYGETATTVEFGVTVSYGEGKSISYVYVLKIRDTSVYNVVNGGFDNGLDGWTMTGDIGEITEKSTYWDGYPVFNDGNYFSGESKEGNKGVLTSSAFKVGGINKISFRLGAAGNKDCYITLEKTDGTVLAVWRNTKFKDVGNWDKDEIGKTQFACNLVTYVADLSDYEGETLKIVLHDNAANGFGFFNFDELVTYYASENDLPLNAFDAVNGLADKTALKAAVNGAITEQGDYTDESFEIYSSKVAAAREILEKVSATQDEVDAAKSAIESAYATLTVRVPEEKNGADKSFSLLAGGSRELTVSDYVDGKNLSGLTYEVTTLNTGITVGDVTDGKFTVTAGSSVVEGAVVSLAVKYNGKVVLTVEITVNVTNETAPVLKNPSVENGIDLYFAENKTDVTIDFAANVENVGGLELSYTVTLNGAELTLDGTSYTYAYGSYTETAEEAVFTVKVSFTHNGTAGELEYTYTLILKDTTAYRITNGGFDNGLEGWTLSNPNLGGVNADETYWAENIPFRNDGKFFNAYFFDGGAKEDATGTLTSSPFTIGGSGWITYKLGGARNADKVFLDIVEKDTGKILARYYNNAFVDDVAGAGVAGCTLVSYRADLSAHIGKTVYIRLCDNAVRDYGLFFADSFVTYYAEQPSDGNIAAEVVDKPADIYQVFNGGFETGNLAGWELTEGEMFGAVSSDEKYFDDNSFYGKDGTYLFTGAAAGNNGTNGEWESKTGVLRSNAVVIRANAQISFKLGGGNREDVGIRIVRFDTKDDGTVEKTVVARYQNTNGAAPEGNLVSYTHEITQITGDTLCYIEIFDYAEGGWGLVTVDSIAITYNN